MRMLRVAHWDSLAHLANSRHHLLQNIHQIGRDGQGREFFAGLIQVGSALAWISAAFWARAGVRES